MGCNGAGESGALAMVAFSRPPAEPWRSGFKDMTLRRKILLIVACLFTAMLIFCVIVANVPVSAVICVPLGYGDLMKAEIERNGIYATRDRVSHFNTQYFRSFPGCGIQTWLSERELLSDATKNGYYCEIEYWTIRGQKWKKAVGNSRMIGLQ
jgi:hypothetical protein